MTLFETLAKQAVGGPGEIWPTEEPYFGRDAATWSPLAEAAGTGDADALTANAAMEPIQSPAVSEDDEAASSASSPLDGTGAILSGADLPQGQAAVAADAQGGRDEAGPAPPVSMRFISHGPADVASLIDPPPPAGPSAGMAMPVPAARSRARGSEAGDITDAAPTAPGLHLAAIALPLSAVPADRALRADDPASRGDAPALATRLPVVSPSAAEPSAAPSHSCSAPAEPNASFDPRLSMAPVAGSRSAPAAQAVPSAAVTSMPDPMTVSPAEGTSLLATSAALLVRGSAPTQPMTIKPGAPMSSPRRQTVQAASATDSAEPHASPPPSTAPPLPPEGTAPIGASPASSTARDLDHPSTERSSRPVAAERATVEPNRANPRPRREPGPSRQPTPMSSPSPFAPLSSAPAPSAFDEANPPVLHAFPPPLQRARSSSSSNAAPFPGRSQPRQDGGPPRGSHASLAPAIVANRFASGPSDEQPEPSPSRLETIAQTFEAGKNGLATPLDNPLQGQTTPLPLPAPGRPPLPATAISSRGAGHTHRPASESAPAIANGQDAPAIRHATRPHDLADASAQSAAPILASLSGREAIPAEAAVRARSGATPLSGWTVDASAGTSSSITAPQRAADTPLAVPPCSASGSWAVGKAGSLEPSTRKPAETFPRASSGSAATVASISRSNGLAASASTHDDDRAPKGPDVDSAAWAASVVSPNPVPTRCASLPLRETIESPADGMASGGNPPLRGSNDPQPIGDPLAKPVLLDTANDQAPQPPAATGTRPTQAVLAGRTAPPAAAAPTGGGGLEVRPGSPDRSGASARAACVLGLVANRLSAGQPTPAGANDPSEGHADLANFSSAAAPKPPNEPAGRDSAPPSAVQRDRAGGRSAATGPGQVFSARRIPAGAAHAPAPPDPPRTSDSWATPPASQKVLRLGGSAPAAPPELPDPSDRPEKVVEPNAAPVLEQRLIIPRFVRGATNAARSTEPLLPPSSSTAQNMTPASSASDVSAAGRRAASPRPTDAPAVAPPPTPAAVETPIAAPRIVAGRASDLPTSSAQGRRADAGPVLSPVPLRPIEGAARPGQTASPRREIAHRQRTHAPTDRPFVSVIALGPVRSSHQVTSAPPPAWHGQANLGVAASAFAAAALGPARSSANSATPAASSGQRPSQPSTPFPSEPAPKAPLAAADAALRRAAPSIAPHAAAVLSAPPPSQRPSLATRAEAPAEGVVKIGRSAPADGVETAIAAMAAARAETSTGLVAAPAGLSRAEWPHGAAASTPPSDAPRAPLSDHRIGAAVRAPIAPAAGSGRDPGGGPIRAAAATSAAGGNSLDPATSTAHVTPAPLGHGGARGRHLPVRKSNARSAAAPPVSIRIGRIRVPSMASTPVRPAPPARPRPTLGLSAYLDRRR